MPFGVDTVTLVSYADGPIAGELGTYPQVETTSEAPGCRHRPLTFKETVEVSFDVATELWKTTIPIGEYSPSVRSQVLALQPDDVIRVDGVQYSIIGGVRPFGDFTSPFKATIFSKRQIG